MNAFNAKNYWQDRLQKHSDLRGVGYERLGLAYNQWMYRIQRFVFLHQVETMHLNYADLDVLDIGSGTGFYVKLWKDLGVKSVTGIDITSVAVEQLKQTYGAYQFYELNIGSANLGNLTEKQFDCISAVAVFLHIVDKDEFEQAIANIHKLLKPGGYLVFTDNFLHQELYSPNSVSHVAIRSLRYYEDVLNRNGFEIVKRAPMFVLMNQPVDTNKSFIKWLWKIMSVAVSVHNIIGFMIGAILFPLELLCVSTFKESPTSEIMICRADNKTP